MQSWGLPSTETAGRQASCRPRWADVAAGVQRQSNPEFLLPYGMSFTWLNEVHPHYGGNLNI